MRILTIIIAFIFPAILSAQLPVWLEAAFENDSVGSIDVVIYANDGITDYLEASDSEYRKLGHSGIMVNLTVKSAKEIMKHPAFKAFEPAFGKALALNDSMVSNNRVIPVHEARDPLNIPFLGKGVLIGFIDTGIDFTHPDFQDSTGKTRVVKIWDQAVAPAIPSRVPSYGYGQVWDSADINLGNCPHDDDVLSHGTNVAGIAAGNGLAIDQYSGVAPEAGIIMVASDFNSSNWLQTVADGVEYIFLEAEKAKMPCVVNISAGEYLGSHDGTDIAAQRIDSMVGAKLGRAVVAAAGNAGNQHFHLGHNVNSDTSFTWFEYNPNSTLGHGAVYFQLWADTADFNHVDFAIGANKSSGNFQFRGRTPFGNISSRINTLVTDSISNGTQTLAVVETYASLIGDKYMLEVHLPQPDSNQYLFSFMTTGNGSFDVWSDAWLGTSHIRKWPLPSSAQLPEIQFYRRPDTLQTMVSSFTCLPGVITVANYTNRNSYVDYNSVTRTFPVTAGERASTSSLGPNRKGYQKPDLTASGDYTITPNRLASIPLHIANGQADRIAKGGMHKRNGGTSMSAPVVSGTIALMLEQCPEISHSQIKTDLLTSVYTDAFTTSNVPNYSYGYGKVSAWDAILKKRVDAGLLPDGVILCSGSSIGLLANTGMAKYIWSSGDSLNPLIVDTAGYYALRVVDSAGCIGYSDTIEVVEVNGPEKPLITKISGNELKSTEAITYQWYRNGNFLIGEQKQVIQVSQDGFYQVVITDSTGCNAISDSVDFQVGIEKFSKTPISLYPNPVKDQLVIRCGISFLDVGIYDNTGRLMMRRKMKQTEYLDVSDLPIGHYTVKISNGEDVVAVRKLVKL